MRDQTQRYDTIVIGGGQAGLATGYYLQQQGQDFVILDAGERIGDAWRKRWDSLRLFTPARYDGLPGMDFPAPAHYYPTKDDMAEYLEDYAASFELPVRTGISVDGLSKQGKQFVLTAESLPTESGQALRFTAQNVVVATGAYHCPKIPAFATELNPDAVQLHSSEYQRPSQLQEGPVLVVGAANSGSEIALELSQSHRIWLSGRHPGSEPTRAGSALDRLVTPLMWFVFSRVLHVKTPVGRRIRPKMLEMGGIPLARVRPADLRAAGVERVHARTVGVQDGMPVLEDGRALDVANVIWCTGFRPDFNWISLPAFDDDGLPVHERGVVASVPGLYFMGLFFLSALTSSLVGGVGKDAEHIANSIAQRAEQSAVAQKVKTPSRSNLHAA